MQRQDESWRFDGIFLHISTGFEPTTCVCRSYIALLGFPASRHACGEGALPADTFLLYL